MDNPLQLKSAAGAACWLVRRVAFVVILAPVLQVVGGAEPEPAKAIDARVTRVGITRADLAASYLRLEQAYFLSPPEGMRAAEINKDFDRATLAFFTGRNAEAIEQIDALTASLRQPGTSIGERASVSVKLIVEPPVWNCAKNTETVLRLVSLYETPLAAIEDVRLELRVFGPTGDLAWKKEIVLKCGPGCRIDTSLAVDQPRQFKAGLYPVELVPSDGRPLVIGRLNVVDGSPLSEQRNENAKMLKQVVAASPQLQQALATCQARNELLSDEPAPANSAQFLANLNSLAQQVRQEVEMLAAGRDPYFRRAGDYWRVLTSEGGEVPLRVYAPMSATTDTPVPLLIALHGAGGDENMFLEAYGAGVIKRIADEHGILIASPSTYRFGSRPQRIADLVDALALQYSIDRDRVYVLGHSMGAGATAGLIRGQSGSIAGACCIAGGNNFQSPSGMPPLLVILAELDAVVPVKSVKAAAERAIASGMPVELKLVPNYGHTLVVGHELPGAVQWLLEHKRATPTSGP